jgi:DNA-binding transcriptional LysR family regulator
MELRHLRYFVAAGETLSFTRAAERLHLSQPALTRQVKDLEEELGVRLLDRTKQRVNLTVEGESFLADAKRLLALSVQIVESVQQLNRRESGVLNIGYAANFFCDVLPTTLALFQNAFPTISANLFDLNYRNQLSALMEGKIDLGFVGLREAADEAGLRFRPVATYKAVIALPGNLPLARKPGLRLKDLASLFFIRFSESSHAGYRHWLDAACRKANFIPRVLQDVELESSLFQSVGTGLGVALVSEQLMAFSPPNVVFRPPIPKVLTESCIAWRAENSSAALQAYLDTIAAFCSHAPPARPGNSQAERHLRHHRSTRKILHR